MTLHALILAGGFGTRLRSVVSDRPKVLADVNGRPFLTYLLESLEAAGLHSVTLLTGYLSSMVEDTIGYRYGNMQIGYSVEVEPLGTGGAIRAAARVIACEQLLVLNGDTFFDVPFNDFTGRLQQAGDLMACRPVADVGRYGCVRIDVHGNVTNMAEKSHEGEGVINGGLYLLEREPLAADPRTRFSLETDYFPQRIEANKLYAHTYENPFIDIGIPTDLEKAASLLMAKP